MNLGSVGTHCRGSDPPSEDRVAPQREIRLQGGNRSTSDKILFGFGCGVAFAFLPLSIIAYCIYQFVIAKGLGREAEARDVDEDRRAELRELGGEEIRFGFEGGALLEGMFFEAQGKYLNPKTILICSGSHGSYEKYAVSMVQPFLDMGYRVMVFNYEGFGNSEGTRSERGIYRSVEAAYQYLRQTRRVEDENIVGWGYSLGSAAVSDLASRYRIDIVLDRGFSSMSEVAYHCAPLGLKTIAKIVFTAAAHFDNLSKLKKASGRILIAQGTRDETMVKERHGERLRESVKSAIYREVDASHHELWFEEGEDREAVEEFLNAQN